MPGTLALDAKSKSAYSIRVLDQRSMWPTSVDRALAQLGWRRLRKLSLSLRSTLQSSEADRRVRSVNPDEQHAGDWNADSRQQRLGPDLVSRIDKALSAHEDGNHTEAVVEAARSLELMIKRVLKEWEIPPDSRATLGQLIGGLRKRVPEKDPLLERLGEFNSIRNRIHDKDARPSKLGEVFEGDSLHCLNSLALIVEWCREVLGHDQADTASDLFPIFLSVGGPHRLEQAQFLQNLRSEMRRLGVQLRWLTQDDYSPDRPFDQLVETMKECAAALVVGLERSHAYTVFERERSERQKIHLDQYIPTAWNQIEGAMASAMGLPLLILCENRLAREGIFEANNHRHQIREFYLATEARGLSEALRGFVTGWVQHVRLSVPAEPQKGVANGIDPHIPSD
jgi:HEPN domain-containing protein